METHDLIVFATVICLRLFIPLLIPRFPLLGVVAALLIDAADQTIFQSQTKLVLDGYQPYDKALDIYYLTIAYLATLRDWTNPFAIQVSRFLFYYRLFGVLLFEVTQVRPLLLIFPNTFEYFFIFYGVVSLGWNPARLTKRALLTAAGLIWVVIKLPQEYWLHVAQMDMTDFVKQSLFGVPANSSWGEAVAANPLILVAFGAILVLVVIASRQLLLKLLTADWTFGSRTATRGVTVSQRLAAEDRLPAHSLINLELVEKSILVSIIVLIFSRILPEQGNGLINLEIGLVLLIVGNKLVSEWLTQRDLKPQFTFVQFVVWAAVNATIATVFIFLLPGPISVPLLETTLFYVLLVTLIVVLYDRYMPIYLARLTVGASQNNASAVLVAN